MVKFVWKDNEDIGFYECYIYEDSDKLDSICFWDYTNKYQKETDEKHRYYRPYTYKISYCNGFAMDKGLDKNEDHDSYGYTGTPKHTIEDVKHWCESYLAAMYMAEYENMLKRLDIVKERYEQLKQMGYSSTFNED